MYYGMCLLISIIFCKIYQVLAIKYNLTKLFFLKKKVIYSGTSAIFAELHTHTQTNQRLAVAGT